MPKVVYKCIACLAEVRPKQHAIACDVCLSWQHRVCKSGHSTGISLSQYRDAVKNGKDIQFVCSVCLRKQLDKTISALDEFEEDTKIKEELEDLSSHTLRSDMTVDHVHNISRAFPVKSAPKTMSSTPKPLPPKQTSTFRAISYSDISSSEEECPSPPKKKINFSSAVTDALSSEPQLNEAFSFPTPPCISPLLDISIPALKMDHTENSLPDIKRRFSALTYSDVSSNEDEDVFSPRKKTCHSDSDYSCEEGLSLSAGSDDVFVHPLEESSSSSSSSCGPSAVTSPCQFVRQRFVTEDSPDHYHPKVSSVLGMVRGPKQLSYRNLFPPESPDFNTVLRTPKIPRPVSIKAPLDTQMEIDHLLDMLQLKLDTFTDWDKEWKILPTASPKHTPLLANKNGFIFCIVNQKEGSVYWRCHVNGKKKKCPVKVKQTGDHFQRYGNWHTHMANSKLVRKYEAIEQVKEKVRETPKMHVLNAINLVLHRLKGSHPQFGFVHRNMIRSNIWSYKHLNI